MNDYDLWLAGSSITSREKVRLLKLYETPENLWCHIINAAGQSDFNGKAAARLKKDWNEKNFNLTKKIIIDKHIKYVTYCDDDYPEKLKVIDDPPFMLFYYGDLRQLSRNKNAAVVGSRNCSPYGINVTKLITKDICANNINIISGMARGIDSIAHREALENNGFTCAVLGCGIDIVYPRENFKLYSEIAEHGCIISEFMPGTPPNSYNFPQRNRIISALSDVVIIVEAGIKSGSLITAGTALDQGKEVIAVPGSIFSEQSKGTNKLIKDGACPFTSMEDIYDAVGIKYKKERTASAGSNNGNKIYNVLTDSPIHIDDIMRMVDIDIRELYELLFEMQLKEEIMCLAGNYYVKISNNI